jgi:CBS domain containing-hemolysin-like protein
MNRQAMRMLLSTHQFRWPVRRLGRVMAVMAVVAATLAAPPTAHASLLSPEAEDTLATVLALFVLFVVPVVLIVLFWMVHILPEKIAHQRHHPQLDAIRTLCLLSLVFGGLLWPLAWIWAYSKPALYKLAYGTDRSHHEDDEAAPGDQAVGLRDRLARLEARHVPASELQALRADLEALEARFPEEAR